MTASDWIGEAIGPHRAVVSVTDKEHTSLLAQAERQAGELAVRVSSPDTKSVEGEVSVSHTGGGWIVRGWAKVKAMAGAKPQASAGIEASKRW